MLAMHLTTVLLLLQYQFNNRILAAAGTQRPVSNCESGSCSLPSAVAVPHSCLKQQSSERTQGLALNGAV